MTYLLATLAVLGGSPAAATGFCDDLWFTRNLVMDRAGYCFGTPLGQSVFDNGDCTSASVSLDRAASQLVDDIQSAEARNQCDVDTTRDTVAINDIENRRQLVDLPIRSETESTCIGWQGEVTPVLAGRDSAAPEIARIEAGDIVQYQHVPVGDWHYVIIATQDFETRGGGWLDLSAGAPDCWEMAG